MSSFILARLKMGEVEERSDGMDEPGRPVSMRRTAFANLAAIVADARAAFGIACFWNTPVLDDPLEDARLVADRLRRHGGRQGWAAAMNIDEVVRETAGASGGVDQLPARRPEPHRP